MVRIYISSTYNDLKEYREKVYHKLRELRHDVIAMEDYVATDQRPQDKCLEDVARSDIYLGLFAWRYGYIPTHNNPEHESITELEYRKAIETGKSRLIFLVDEQIAWTPAYMDQTTGEGDQGKRIMELCKELKLERIVSSFHSPDHLAGLVASAVTLWEKEQSGQNELTIIDKLLIQIASMHKAISNDASQFSEENVYPEQCNFVSDDLRAADRLIQELLDAVNHLSLSAGSLRFQLSKTLYHAEALSSELIRLVGAFRPICRLGSRQATTKKNEIQLKLLELAQSLDIGNKTLEQLTGSVKGKETVVYTGEQQPQSVTLPVSPTPATYVTSTTHVTDSAENKFTQLGVIIFNKYDADEFKLLCIRMGTDYDSLRAGMLELKMYYLIDYCNRHGKYEMLIQQMLKDFPDLQGQL